MYDVDQISIAIASRHLELGTISDDLIWLIGVYIYVVISLHVAFSKHYMLIHVHVRIV